MVSSSLVEQRQAEEKAAWDAYWQLRDLDSRGTIFPRMRYYAHKAFDAPATWFRETIVQPINNRNRLPYYQRKLNRVPEIDECGVNDKVIEDLEENELNFFIKYGELGSEADVRDAYMKQKHRLIWERRHPEIMEERQRAIREHKVWLWFHAPIF
ncbi:hypothetical protein TELCIR_10367 [Teladorsagia circumcincta]|uniref:NADH dehydrogenase [ubiquinone] 1 beta subcomplex subunit 10 n=1 Tax=Teladorsagia circumcincta TaxID=45464 RepID=A0A2G9UEG2_TELCI|nr:hypothetical protein TELCIR_10367 [Teladorsagia circumcincta]